ncbi:MAG: NEW3 domain-containing protein [Acidimicrobiales bacterium]
MFITIRRTARPLVVCFLIAAFLNLVPAPPAGAVELGTKFPTVKVRPGDTQKFELNVSSGVRERVAIRVVSVPDKWAATLRGGGLEIGEVTLTDTERPFVVELEVKIPADATPGENRLQFEALAPSGRSNLEMVLNVSDNAVKPYEHTADFTKLVAASDQTFRFNVQIVNNTTRETSFALAAQGPDGWQTSAKPAAEEKASTVKVPANGQKMAVTVEADPPDDVSEGEYDVKLTALSDDNRPIEVPLKATVIGKATLAFATANERLNASGNAGNTSSVNLKVTNQGNAPLTAVKLNSTPPNKWTVTFEPSTIAQIGPNETVDVVAKVRPQGNAVAGDYALTLTATAAGQTKNLDVRYAVKTSSVWGFVGIGIIVAAIGGLLYVFRRYGRR